MTNSTKIPIHGNYYGYYLKRPNVDDVRLALLSRDFFVSARVLDVGTNDGKVACEIAQSMGAHFVIGVDIDEGLIQAAWKRRRTAWSTQAPSNPAAKVNESKPAVSNREQDKTIGDGTSDARSHGMDGDRHYFPASFEHELGPLPVPPVSNRGKTVFPHNLVFRTADWVNTEIPEDAARYDVVLALSITKWIHLNQGDQGLIRFFNRVYAVLKPGGSFVLEPQSWESYGKAKRMDATLKENAKRLTLHPSEFERVLREIGFDSVDHCGFTGDGGFHRPIDVYVKSSAAFE